MHLTTAIQFGGAVFTGGIEEDHVLGYSVSCYGGSPSAIVTIKGHDGIWYRRPQRGPGEAHYEPMRLFDAASQLAGVGHVTPRHPLAEEACRAELAAWRRCEARGADDAARLRYLAEVGEAVTALALALREHLAASGRGEIAAEHAEWAAVA